MGYYVDVHICVGKDDLPILFSDINMGMFTCSHRSESIVYAYSTGLKLTNWWDDLKETIQQCKEYHYIMIGEDGTRSEDYSNEPMMDVITTIDLPPQIKPITKDKCKLYTEVYNILNLALPKEFKVCKSGFIDYTQVVIAYMYTVEGRLYIRRYKDSVDNCPKLFKDILNMLCDNYMLICIKPGIYEIKYKP